MGFLIEIRSGWSSNPHQIVKTLEAELEHAKAKAEKLGFSIIEKAWIPVSKEWQDYIAEKYNHFAMTDHTRNIYGNPKHTHHTGFMFGRATAGCHVHFSRWDTEKERFVWFTDEEIKFLVRKMDDAFKNIIKSTGRVLGEWEPKRSDDDTKKPHGFEYRSLPATVDKLKVAKTALSVLLSLEKHPSLYVIAEVEE